MPHLTEAPRLGNPLELRDPIPNYGCDVCASLGRQREEARLRQDMTTVTDCNIEIRRHPHTARS